MVGVCDGELHVEMLTTIHNTVGSSIHLHLQMYRKIKTSQGKIFTDSMASRGLLTDFVSRCLFNLPPKISTGMV